jgi:hypothetical protein
MILYKQVKADRCTKQVGLMCGYPESEHPLNVSGNCHEFMPGSHDWVKATKEDIEQALQLITD